MGSPIDLGSFTDIITQTDRPPDHDRQRADQSTLIEGNDAIVETRIEYSPYDDLPLMSMATQEMTTGMLSGDVEQADSARRLWTGKIVRELGLAEIYADYIDLEKDSSISIFLSHNLEQKIRHDRQGNSRFSINDAKLQDLILKKLESEDSKIAFLEKVVLAGETIEQRGQGMTESARLRMDKLVGDESGVGEAIVDLVLNNAQSSTAAAMVLERTVQLRPDQRAEVADRLELTATDLESQLRAIKIAAQTLRAD